MYSITVPAALPRSAPQSSRLLDQVRERIRYLHCSLRTEEVYLYWIPRFVRFGIPRFVRFDDRRHPRA
jgi:hypothetical protein